MADAAPSPEHGENSDHRDERGRFVRGNRSSVGNSGQRARGRLRRALERALTDDDLDAVVAAAVRSARRGERHARAWLFDRLGGRVRLEPDDSRAALELGPLDTLANCATAQKRITCAASSGAISLANAAALAELVTATADRLRDGELEERLTALELLANDHA